MQSRIFGILMFTHLPNKINMDDIKIMVGTNKIYNI